MRHVERNQADPAVAAEPIFQVSIHARQCDTPVPPRSETRVGDNKAMSRSLVPEMPCIFIDAKGANHLGVILGDDGESAWALLHDARVVLHFSLHEATSKEGTLFFNDCARYAPLSEVFEETVEGRTPIFWHCTDEKLRASMLGIARTWHIVLPQADTSISW